VTQTREDITGTDSCELADAIDYKSVLCPVSESSTGPIDLVDFDGIRCYTVSVKTGTFLRWPATEYAADINASVSCGGVIFRPDLESIKLTSDEKVI
jgi:hypothetical protein